jgi:hypothetical protein
VSTVRRVEVYAIDGKPLPIDVMMSNMRYYHTAAVKSANMLSRVRKSREHNKPEVIEDLERIVTKNRTMSQDLAKDAAPYFHSRLEAVMVTDGSGIGGASLATAPLVVQFYDPTEADPGVTDAEFSVVADTRVPEAAE